MSWFYYLNSWESLTEMLSSALKKAARFSARKKINNKQNKFSPKQRKYEKNRNGSQFHEVATSEHFHLFVAILFKRYQLKCYSIITFFFVSSRWPVIRENRCWSQSSSTWRPQKLQVILANYVRAIIRVTGLWDKKTADFHFKKPNFIIFWPISPFWWPCNQTFKKLQKPIFNRVKTFQWKLSTLLPTFEAKNEYK